MSSLRMLSRSFDIVEKPYWQKIHQDSVETILRSIADRRRLVEKTVTGEDLFWVGFANVHDKVYLLECVAGESNDNKLRYDDVEKLVNAGFFRKLWTYIFAKKQYKTILKLQNLRRAMKDMFPNCILFMPSSLGKLTIKFVRDIHRQVGKDLIRNAGKFRTKDAKPAQEDFYYLSPHSIEERLEKLLKECREVFSQRNLSLVDAVKYGACFLSEFLYIHPFSNGNGRVTRLLLSYLLTEHTVVPLSLYSSNSGRDTYLNCLRETREHHTEYRKPASLTRFILENIDREFRFLWNTLALEEKPETSGNCI